MKKFISVVLLLSIMMLSTSSAFAVSNYEANASVSDSVITKYGDCDSDNNVTIKDASLIQKHTASLITLTEEQLNISDVDGNGRVNIVDATWIQKKVASICDKFPAETENTEPTTEETTETVTTTAVATDPTETTVVATEASTAPADPTETTSEATEETTVENSSETSTEATTEEATETVTTTAVATEASTAPAEPTEPVTEATTAPADPTEPVTEATTAPAAPTETTSEATEETTVENSTETSTEATTEEATEDITTEPATEDYKPIDTVEGDFITQEMLWTIEEGFHRLVNEERARLGLDPYLYKKGLDDAAQIRSAELIINYSHTRPDGTPCYSVIEDPNALRLLMIGENIYGAYGNALDSQQKFTGTQEELELICTSYFNAFKNSPGHYANMIDKDFNFVGIGISYVYDKDNDAYLFYISHIFGQCY